MDSDSVIPNSILEEEAQLPYLSKQLISSDHPSFGSIGRLASVLSTFNSSNVIIWVVPYYSYTCGKFTKN